MSTAMFKHSIRFLCIGHLFISLAVHSQNPGIPWPAMDGLGRKLTTATNNDMIHKKRYAGIFYFLWHEKGRRSNPENSGPYDIMKIIEKDPGALSNPNSPLWGPNGT